MHRIVQYLLYFSTDLPVWQLFRKQCHKKTSVLLCLASLQEVELGKARQMTMSKVLCLWSYKYIVFYFPSKALNIETGDRLGKVPIL